MDAGGWAMAAVIVLSGVVLGWILFATARSIRDHRTPGGSLFRQFGLGLILMFLFFLSWILHGVAQWQTFTDEQRSFGEPVEVGDFVAEFMQSTMENWQSEFLQLFSFVTLAALYIHKGSAESKDSDEKVEASLRRIEAHLGTLPAEQQRPAEDAQEWQLPETPTTAG